MKTLDKNGFFAPVEAVDTASILNGIYDVRSDRSKAVVVTKPDGGRSIVNLASKSYGLHTTTELFGRLEAEMDGKIDYEVQYFHEDYKRFYADYTLKGRMTSIGNLNFKGDNVAPKIRVMHSYDSWIPFTFQIGMWRQICTNGLHGFKFEQRARVKNTVGATPEIYRVMVAEMESLLESVKQIEVVYNGMADRMVHNWTERIEEVVLASGFPTRQVEQVTQRLMFENSLGLPITDWLIYNAFNGELNHNGTIKTDEYKRMELDTVIFETLAK
jgi:hypothetical protein